MHSIMYVVGQRLCECGVWCFACVPVPLFDVLWWLLFLFLPLKGNQSVFRLTLSQMHFQGLEVWGMVVVMVVVGYKPFMTGGFIIASNGLPLLKHQTPGTQKEEVTFGTSGDRLFHSSLQASDTGGHFMLPSICKSG